MKKGIIREREGAGNHQRTVMEKQRRMGLIGVMRSMIAMIPITPMILLAPILSPSLAQMMMKGGGR